MWRESGKPRQGQLFTLMCQAKARFKYALRSIKQHENKLRSDSLAKSLSKNKNDDFWKEIRVMNNAKTPLPNNIGGVSGKENITEVWRKHFMDLFNVYMIM